MIGWRVPLATGALVMGVSFSTESGTGWKLLAGMLLVFVPALIVDHVLSVVTGRQHVHEPVPTRPESYPQEYPPETTAAPTGNHPDLWIGPEINSDTEIIPAVREYP